MQKLVGLLMGNKDGEKLLGAMVEIERWIR